MGSRIAGKFRELRKKNSKAFIPYVMAGARISKGRGN